MSKFLVRMLTVILTASLIALSFLVVINFTSLSREVESLYLFDKDNPPLYRFMVIIDGEDLNYVKEFESGAMKAAQDYSVAFELWKFEGKSKKESIIRQFDIAVQSNVDGIIIEAFDDEQLVKVLDKAVAKSIPVITIGENISGEKTVSCIAYNKYNIGNQIGTLLNEIFNEKNIDKGTIALLQEDSQNGQDIRFAINEKLTGEFRFKQISIDTSGADLLNSEDATREIIRKNEDLVAIICSSGEETLGAVQSLKDTDKIGDVIVIGNDDNIEILDYLERGIISGTVVSDNELLGYESIVNMVNYKNGKLVSEYKDIRIKLVTEDTVASYREEIGGANEEE